MFEHRRNITIEWGDCDPAGIVFFPRYLAIFDSCTWSLFTAALGMSKKTLLARFGTVGCPMVDLRARFLIPCSFGDEVVVEAGSPSSGAAASMSGITCSRPVRSR